MHSTPLIHINEYRPFAELIPQDWQRLTFTASDGAELSFLQTDSSPKLTLILLHGFQSAGYMWLRTAQVLADDYRLIMPDLRGHGFSSVSITNFSLERLTEDIIELIQYLELQHPVLIGHSLGGEIAGRIAAQESNLPLGVILVDPPLQAFAVPMPSEGEMTPWLAQWLARMQAIQTQPHPERLHTALQLMMPGTPLWAEADLVTFAETCGQFNLALLPSVSTMNYALDTPAIAGKITAPVLLMSAQNSPTPQHLLTRTNRQHSQFTDSGHFIPMEQFETFVRQTRGFVSDL